jgi:CubicO group peptidase (beta-lactamase class C family)
MNNHLVTTNNVSAPGIVSHSRFFLLVLFAVLLFPNLAQSQDIDLSALENTINEELKQTKTPGASIGIVKGNRLIFAKGFGVANVETNAVVTPETLFRLGSTTKMFTGAALVALSSDGKLRLDAPIGDHSTELNPSLARLTVHQLLSQTAGMADFQAPFISQDDEALSRMVRGWKEEALFAEPGQLYSYSSPGYWLAGYVIEETSKKPYATAMNDLIFAPLGMKHTTLRPLEAMTYPLAMGHDVGENSKPAIVRPAFNNVAMWPAGSIYSSVNDLSRFVIALINGGTLDGKQVLKAEVPGKLFGRYAPMPGDPAVHYGYGVLNFEMRGVRVLMHGGFSRGYGSMIQMFPEEGLAVIVQTNRSGQTLPRSRAKAIELFLKLQPEQADKPKKPGALTETERANFAGKYVNGPQTWDVSNRAGKLYFKTDDGEAELTRTGPYLLSYGANLDNDLVFVPNKRGEIEFVFDGLYSARKKSN